MGKIVFFILSLGFASFFSARADACDQWCVDCVVNDAVVCTRYCCDDASTDGSMSDATRLTTVNPAEVTYWVFDPKHYVSATAEGRIIISSDGLLNPQTINRILRRGRVTTPARMKR